MNPKRRPQNRFVPQPLPWERPGGGNKNCRSGSLAVPKTPRRAFTLVEMLMVIAIIGILAALLLVAVNAARNAAARGRVSMQINHLSTALERFQQKYGAYPPTFGDGEPPAFATGASYAVSPFDAVSQQTRILRQFRKMFPRYNVGQWDDLRDTLAAATRTEVNGTGVYASGLDVNDLDAAESLVFWLGGIPHVTSKSPYVVELTRFSADPTSPLTRSTNVTDPDRGTSSEAPFSSKRTEPLIEFTGLTLVDVDDDGWPEVRVDIGSDTGGSPPLVYFDAESYAKFPFYPPAYEDNVGRAQEWGIAQPYVQTFVPGGQVTFAGKDKFQIICAGFDKRFDDTSISDEGDIVGTAAARQKFIKGKYIKVSDGSLTSISGGEFDNFANFVNGTLESQFDQ